MQPVQHRRRDVLGGVVAQTPGGQLGGAARPEAGEADRAGRTTGRGALGEGERRAGLAAQGGQQHGTLAGEVVRQIVDDGERVGVRVVQILQHQDAAALPAEDVQEPEHRLGVPDERGAVLRCQPAQPGQQRFVEAQIPARGRPLAP